MEDRAIRREYRAAAVFYGGVSLAVYENGVARAFFDAAKRDGTVNAHEKTTPLVAGDATDDAVHRVKTRLHLLYRYLDAEWFEGNNPPTRVAELSSDALSHMKSQAQTWLQRALTTATAEGQGDFSIGFDRSASGQSGNPTDSTGERLQGFQNQ
jgi:hypothetical protein